MQNVYGAIGLFYKEKPTGTSFLFSKDTIERFLRRNAWNGADDNELKRQWRVLSILLTLSAEWKLDSMDLISTGDYREMFRRFAEFHKNPGKITLSEDLLYFFDTLKSFLKYHHINDDFLSERLNEAYDSFFAAGIFLMPKPQEKDEFYSILEHKEILQEEDITQLNKVLDGLLTVLGDYYHKERYFRDFTRAIIMYGGKDFKPESPPKTNENEDYLFGFWDYFLFDYHIMNSDLTPLENFYALEHNNLTYTETSIILDLLKARFTIFTITGVDDDVVNCKELFTGKQLELPVPDSYMTDYSKTLFLGHVHSGGVMLLNYVTTIPAGHKLRERIRREIIRLYEMFKYQMPDAELSDFFRREAAAVRQTILILTEYAQLNVLPFRKYNAPVDRNAYPVPEYYNDTVEKLKNMGQTIRMSSYSLSLLGGLYLDYCILSDDESEVKKSLDALNAVLYVFLIINGMTNRDARRCMSVFKGPWEYVKRLADSIYITLQCSVFDPRYLTEDAFVQMLFAKEK